MYSLDASSRMLAAANQCRNVDTIIQSINDSSNDSRYTKSQLIDLIESMELIQNSLAICQDDYRRLVLAYHKFMHYKYDIAVIENANDEEKFISNIDLKYPSNFNEVQAEEEAEFYALLERTEEEEEEVTKKRTGKNAMESIDEEIKRIDSKVIRKHFKPVLKQLKDKIDPINQSMRDRERRYFEAQGINFDDETQSLKANDSDNSDNSNESDEDKPNVHKRKVQMRKNKYDDVRKFLEDKQQISLFSLPPPNVYLTEDVLE